MTWTVAADDRGQIVIPHEIREKHGDQYRIVELDDRIALFSLADDPVEGLRDAIDDAFDDRSITEIKREAREGARDTALDDVDRDGSF